MGQLDKRLAQMEATERARLSAELEAFFEGLTDDEWDALDACIFSADGRPFSALSNEELDAIAARAEKGAPIDVMRAEFDGLKPWLAELRADVQPNASF